MNKLILSALMALFCCLTRAIDIRGTYIEPGRSIYGVSSMFPPNLSGGGNLQAVFDQAANNWNSKIGDNWSLNIQYGWSNSIGNALAEYHGWWFPFGDQRHIQARILFNPKYSWFADATPWEHSEFSNYSETSRDYGAGPMNVGRRYLSGPSGFDLLSVAMHEIGHSLSIGVGPRWANEVADGHVDLTSPRLFAGSRIPVSGGHLADSTSLMYFGTAQGIRTLISDADLLSGMQASGFEITPVPEPVTILSLLMGVAFLIRKKRRSRGSSS